jgi:periplasmic protein CpxP/Spy
MTQLFVFGSRDRDLRVEEKMNRPSKRSSPMKRQICSVALSTLFGLGVAIAAPQTQDPSAAPQSAPDTANREAVRGHADPNRQVQMMAKRLNLSDDQQKQLLPILTSRRDQMESLRSDTSLSAKDRHAKMKSIREATDTQIRALLNDSQKQTYDQMQQQMRERGQERREQHQNSGTAGGTQ